MLSIYCQAQSQVSVIELYVNESKEEYEGSYEVINPNAIENQDDCTIESDVEDVTNALANHQHPFKDPSFMHNLDLEAMNILEFSKYANADSPIVAESKFIVRIEFNFKETVTKVVKDYIIGKEINY
ncbi:hypothetical protein AHAS_Ahas17G0136300 [Arachis hypogaea]